MSTGGGPARWRPGERVYHTSQESQLLQTGPWRTSRILNGPERPVQKNQVTDSRPPWGKGEVATSALRRQALERTSATVPSAEEEEFINNPVSMRLASVQNELQNTYIARQFKKHLETQSDSIPEFLKGVTEEKKRRQKE